MRSSLKTNGLYERVPHDVRKKMANGEPPSSPQQFLLRFGGLFLLCLVLLGVVVLQRSRYREGKSHSPEVKQNGVGAITKPSGR
jgi:hypothetical protein